MKKWEILNYKILTAATRVSEVVRVVKNLGMKVPQTQDLTPVSSLKSST